MKKAKLIYEFFEGYTKEEVDQAIKKLPAKDKKLIKLRYGEDLANPKITPFDAKQYSRLYITVFGRMQKILKGVPIKKPKKVKNIYEILKKYKKEEVDQAIKKLSVKDQEMIALICGDDLERSKVNEEEMKELNQTVIRKLRYVLSKSDSYHAKKKTIYEYFSDYSKDAVDNAIASLPEGHRDLITLRYGEDLSNPVFNTLSKDDRGKFYGNALSMLSRILSGKNERKNNTTRPAKEKKPVAISDSKELEIQEINLSDEETISSAVTTLETDSLIKDDYYDILNFLKRPTFIQMVEKLNSVKKAVILALRYGYIDDKYYSKSAIAEFLNIDLEEISQAEEDALLLHKENINSYFDKVIDTVTGSRNKK